VSVPPDARYSDSFREMFRTGGAVGDSDVHELTRLLSIHYGELRAIHLVAHLRTVEVVC